MGEIHVYGGEFRKYFWLLPPPEGNEEEFLIDSGRRVLMVTDETPLDKVMESAFTASLFEGMKVVVFPDLEDLKGERRDAFMGIYEKRERIQNLVFATIRGEGKGRGWWEKLRLRIDSFPRTLAVERASRYADRLASSRGVELPRLAREYIMDNLPEDPREFVALLENAIASSGEGTVLKEGIAEIVEEKKILELNVFVALEGVMVKGDVRALGELYLYVDRISDSTADVLKMLGAIKWFTMRMVRGAKTARERQKRSVYAEVVSRAELAMKGGSRLSQGEILKNLILELAVVSMGKTGAPPPRIG